ncbi:MAG TPA: OmpA family protein [Candidatus Acidoferrales bacterium]|nr:OmpA family protein [Candidatus Acidoferrales bacterium]
MPFNALINATSRTRRSVPILCLGIVTVLGLTTPRATAQAQTAPTAAAANPGVSRTAKAITFRRGTGTIKVPLRGTGLMPQGVGEANVENKGNRVEIDAKFQNMEDATKFGFEYLTYVVWAVSPEGRAVNLGELQLKNGNGEVKAMTDMQIFAVAVTAEPYFAVTQPGNEVVLENSEMPGAENISATYQLLPQGAYSSSNTKIDNLIFGIDRKTPTELFEARNAVRIANNANASQYAADVIAKASQQLQSAEEAYRQKRDKTAVIAMSRDAIQTAEEARVISVKKKAEEDAQAQAAAEKQAAEERAAKARAEAAAEAAQLEAAEQARQQAEAAKADAERAKQEALAEAAQAAQAKAEAEQARQAALAEQQAALAQKQDALAQKQAAEAEAQQAREAAAKADAEKADLRKQLLAQLNSILQTNDSARGLIVNMSDVLFDTGSYTLKPGARETMAKISGILLAHPGLTLQIEGYTDSVGSDDYNQQLSEQRAASVRDFLAQEGVPASSITAKGLGKADPVASNDTPEGRQRNRRVEIVVNGASIDATTPSAAVPAAAPPALAQQPAQ